MDHRKHFYQNQVKKDKRKRLIKAGLLLLTACLLIGGWFAWNHYEQEHFHQTLSQVATKAKKATGKMTHQQLVNNQKNAAKNNQNDLKTGNLSASQIAAAKRQASKLKSNIVGGIYIPAAKIKEAILSTDSNTNLAFGAGMMADRQMGGKNNYVLAGHNMEPYSTTLFTTLSEAKDGDKIYVTDLDNVFIYKITSEKVINPKDVTILDNQGKQSLITLITCHADGSNRLAVRGKLIASPKYSSKYSHDFTFQKKNQV